MGNAVTSSSAFHLFQYGSSLHEEFGFLEIYRLLSIILASISQRMVSSYTRMYILSGGADMIGCTEDCQI